MILILYKVLIFTIFSHHSKILAKEFDTNEQKNSGFVKNVCFLKKLKFSVNEIGYPRFLAFDQKQRT